VILSIVVAEEGLCRKIKSQSEWHGESAEISSRAEMSAEKQAVQSHAKVGFRTGAE
jgi:hypothetical protein